MTPAKFLIVIRARHTAHVITKRATINRARVTNMPILSGIHKPFWRYGCSGMSRSFAVRCDTNGGAHSALFSRRASFNQLLRSLSNAGPPSCQRGPDLTQPETPAAPPKTRVQARRAAESRRTPARCTTRPSAQLGFGADDVKVRVTLVAPGGEAINEVCQMALLLRKHASY